MRTNNKNRVRDTIVSGRLYNRLVNERYFMIPNKRIPTHPGEILLQEFLQPMEISQMAFAKHVGVSVQRINAIVRGKRGITPDTAWRFAQAFGTTPEFWMNLQAAHDLAFGRPKKKVERMHHFAD